MFCDIIGVKGLEACYADHNSKHSVLSDIAGALHTKKISYFSDARGKREMSAHWLTNIGCVLISSYFITKLKKLKMSTRI